MTDKNNIHNLLGAIPPRPLDPTALQGKVLAMRKDPAMERLAILFVVNCFRYTVLEKYHREWPQFTDEKMKVLMQATVNKLHTALHAFFTGDSETRDAVWEVLHWNYPAGWDVPEFDQGLLRSIELTKQARKQEAKAAAKAARTVAADARGKNGVVR